MTAYLFAAGQPGLDLVIRSGGEMRLSNFRLWPAAFAGFYACDVYWPDFPREQFFQALEAYASRQRRFGGHSPSPPDPLP